MIPVYQRVEEIRKQKKISKASIARSLGITPMGYHYISIGRTPLSTDRMQIIANVLGISSTDLLCKEVNEKFITVI